MDLSTAAPVHHVTTVCHLVGIRLPSAKEVGALGPPPEARPGFLTFYDTGWSIMTLCYSVLLFRKVLRLPWIAEKTFATRSDGPRYRQVRLTPVSGSEGKNYDEQLDLLGPDEEVPAARVLIAGLLIHSLATGERLLPTSFVRCADLSDRYRVIVGDFNDDGLGVGLAHDNTRRGSVGLAALKRW